MNFYRALIVAPLRQKGERVVAKSKASGLKFFEAFKLRIDQVLLKVYLAKVSSKWLSSVPTVQHCPSMSNFPSSDTGKLTHRRGSESFKVKNNVTTF